MIVDVSIVLTFITGNATFLALLQVTIKEIADDAFSEGAVRSY